MSSEDEPDQPSAQGDNEATKSGNVSSNRLDVNDHESVDCEGFLPDFKDQCRADADERTTNRPGAMAVHKEEGPDFKDQVRNHAETVDTGKRKLSSRHVDLPEFKDQVAPDSLGRQQQQQQRESSNEGNEIPSVIFQAGETIGTVQAELVQPYDEERLLRQAEERARQRFLRETVPADTVRTSNSHFSRWKLGGALVLTVSTVVGVALAVALTRPGSTSDATNQSPGTVQEQTIEACMGARRLAADSTFPVSVRGSLHPESSAVSMLNPAQTCPTMNSGDLASWYALDATGLCYAASILFDDESEDSLSTVLSLLALGANGCEELSCLQITDMAELRWNSQPGFEYRLLVSDSTPKNFTVKVAEISCLPNDGCWNAEDIPALPFSTAGSTDGATPEGRNDSSLDCSVVAPQGRSLYYHLTGTGECIAATLRGTQWDTTMGVYTGTCNRLICLRENDNEGTFTFSSVIWESSVLTDYYIVVSGAEAQDYGDFLLNITKCAKHYEVCRNETIIDEFPFEDEFSDILVNTSIFEDQGCLAVRGTDFGVIYNIIGTGGCFVASSLGSTDRNSLSVFEGDDCTQLTCVTDSIGGLLNDNFESKISWKSEPNSTYRVLVGGFGPPTPSFSVLVEEFDCPQNDFCENATVVNNLPFTDHGSTDNAEGGEFGDPLTECPAVLPFSKSLWWEVEGTGSCLQASTAGSDFDTILAVYSELDGCNELACVAENDDVDPLGSSKVAWKSEMGSMYKVLVSGFGSKSGKYLLELSEFSCLDNAMCESAQLLDNLPAQATGRLALVTTPMEMPARACNLIFEHTKGLWFSLSLASGSCVEASTVGTNFTNVIAIFTGDCGNLECVVQTRDNLLSFNAQAATYRILVAGFGDSVGNFTFSVRECQ